MTAKADPVEVLPSSGGGDIVSQSEVELLLAQMGSGDQAAAGGPIPATPGSAGREMVHRHDFPQLSFFSPGELRRLRVWHEEFIGALAARLSVHLGLEVVLQMAKLETQHFQKFVDSLSNPTHLTPFKLEPLRGICLLDLPPRLALCIVDRELGGLGHCRDDARDLSKMETALVSRCVESMLGEWCAGWSGIFDLRPVLLRCESNGHFLQTSSPDTSMLILGIETRLGGVVEQMQLAFPHFTLEPLIHKLNARIENDEAPTDALAPQLPRWNPALDDMALRITADLPDIEISASLLADLKPGDVIPLRFEAAQQAVLRVEGLARFAGVLGTSNAHWAVKISQVLGV